jgi:hypothetical protein
MHQEFNLLKPPGYVMHQQFNIQQLYVLPHTVFMGRNLVETRWQLYTTSLHTSSTQNDTIETEYNTMTTKYKQQNIHNNKNI